MPLLLTDRKMEQNGHVTGSPVLESTVACFPRFLMLTADLQGEQALSAPNGLVLLPLCSVTQTL